MSHRSLPGYLVALTLALGTAGCGSWEVVSHTPAEVQTDPAETFEMLMLSARGDRPAEVEVTETFGTARHDSRSGTITLTVVFDEITEIDVRFHERREEWEVIAYNLAEEIVWTYQAPTEANAREFADVLVALVAHASSLAA